MIWRVRRTDLLFMIETLMPGREDREHVADLIVDETDVLEGMLDDERLFERLTSEDEMMLQVSPGLLFAVLLRRARRDLEQAAYTTELRQRQKVVLFDTPQVVELLEDRPLRDYLAAMLASFTRIESVTVRVRISRGIWHRYRVSELDVEGMIRSLQSLDEEQRYAPYKRIADVCLFLSGMFPEHIASQHRYPVSRQIRPRRKGQLLTTLEDYEAHGRAFYQLAAEHPVAQVQGLTEVLHELSQRFILAEKALHFVATHYLHFARHKLFEV